MEIHARWMVLTSPAPFYGLILSKCHGSVSCMSWYRNWEEALGMAARGERLSSIKIRLPDASLIRISRLAFPCSLGSGEELNWCLPRPQVTLLFQKPSVPSLSLLPPQGFCWGRTRMAAEMCVHHEPLQMSWTERDPEAMPHGSLRVCQAAASLSSVAAVAIVLLRCPRRRNTWFWWVSTSWLNKTASLLVVRNVSGEEKKKASLCIASARQLVRPGI